MTFDPPLLRGTLIARYKRFLADVRLDTGETVVAHCANSGSMLSVDAAGSEVWLSPAMNPARRLRYTWELIRVGGVLVGINTDRPNRIATEAIAAGSIPELAGYATVRREVPYGTGSRIDLLLEGPEALKCFVEVKNVTLKRSCGAADVVEFPDCITVRGRKHLGELSRCVAEGARGVMLYIVQRNDADRLAIASDIDPAYAASFAQALDAGVEALCYACAVSATGISVARRLKIDVPAAAP